MLSQIQASTPFVTFVAFCKISSVLVIVRLAQVEAFPYCAIHHSQSRILSWYRV
jgi:hypothetical protein